MLFVLIGVLGFGIADKMAFIEGGIIIVCCKKILITSVLMHPTKYHFTFVRFNAISKLLFTSFLLMMTAVK